MTTSTTAGSRGLFFAAYACIGLGIGLIVYRFAVLGWRWQGEPAWLFPGLAIGLILGGKTLIKRRDEAPPLLQRFAVAIVGAAAAMGAAFLVVPPLGHARLTARQLPGFTIDLPSGEVEAEILEYENGKLSLKRVAGTSSLVAVQWEAGPAAREDLELAARALAEATGGSNDRYRLTQLPGPGGAPVDAAIVETDKGPLYLAMIGCGARRVTVVAMGASDIDGVHRRMVASLACKPDAAKDALRPGEIRLALTLPGWFAQERLPGQLTLTDGTSALLLRAGTPSKPGALEEMLPPLFGAMGATITLGARVADRVPFTGRIEGDAVAGWGRQQVCGAQAVTLIAITPDQATADALATVAASARCLRDGEAPPVWPDPPAGTGIGAPPE